MAAGVRPIDPSPADPFLAAHARLRTDGAIQFDFPAFAPPVTPDWLLALARWLRPLFERLAPFSPYLRFLLWIALAALLLFVGWRLYRRFGHLRRKGRVVPDKVTSEDWRPEAAPARALLDEADALAAAGQFAEAARLLLHRSIAEIERHRPRLIRPSATSRDIAATTELPVPARDTFAAIARTVERGLFAGRAVDAAEWRSARTAYEDFAFPAVWR